MNNRLINPTSQGDFRCQSNNTLNTSVEEDADLRSIELDGTGEFVGTSKDQIIISRVGQRKACNWNAVKCLILMIIIMVVATTIICIGEAIKHEKRKNEWKPKIIPPILGPFSTPTCEEYVNKNYSAPLDDQLVTFEQADDWTLKQIWIYQED